MSFSQLPRWFTWASSWWQSVLRSFSSLLSLLTPAKKAPDEDVEECRRTILQEASKRNKSIKSSEHSEHPTVITYRHVKVRPGAEIPKPRFGEIIYIAKGEFLTRGGTAILERLSSGEVIKTPTPNPFFPGEEDDCRRSMLREAQVYDRVGGHPRVPRFIKWDQDTCCLTIEYMENGNLRDYIQKHHTTITSELRLRWAKQAAEGLQLLHSVDVIHCDISPRNFLLDGDLNLKISDFAGSSLSGSMPSAYSSTRYRHPDSDWDVPRLEDDIFGLGSLIYFIMTNNYPYEEVSSDEVERLYKCRQFPEVTHLTCGGIIEKCWHYQVDAAQVCDYLERLMSH